jgi:hypothetical protein
VHAADGMQGGERGGVGDVDVATLWWRNTNFDGERGSNLLVEIVFIRSASIFAFPTH